MSSSSSSSQLPHIHLLCELIFMMTMMMMMIKMMMVMVMMMMVMMMTFSHPFILWIERLLWEDHLLSAAAKLIFVDVELSGVSFSFRALTVEYIVEQLARNLWLLQKLLEDSLGWIIPCSVTKCRRTFLSLPFCSTLIEPEKRRKKL